MIHNITIDSSFFGLEFLPIEKKNYLKIQSILRRLQARFSSLRETFFLYRDQIIWYIYIYIFIPSTIYIYIGFLGVVFVNMIQLYSIHFFDYIIGHILKHWRIHLLYGKKKEM